MFRGPVAFEMAQQFSKENETPILIILNTLRPPQTPHTPRAPAHLGWLWRLMRVLKRRGNDPQAEPFLKPLAVAQARARRNYVTKTYSGRITLIQSDVGVQSRTNSKGSRVAAGGLECYRIPGRHRGILEDSRLQETAQVLQQCLQKLQMEPTASGCCS
jgi:thioesterase domain-containing protein